MKRNNNQITNFFIQYNKKYEEVFILAKILVFNNDTDRMETYYRGENEPMPYNTNGTLKVKEFRGSSRSNILWTTKRCMQSWNSQRYIFRRSYTSRICF